MTARSAARPQVDFKFSAGLGPRATALGQDDDPVFGAAQTQGQAAISVKQLIFDFGATRSDIKRAKSGLEAQNQKLYDKAEDVTEQMANAYLKILEQRALSAAAKRNLAATRKLASLVDANQKDGNGTVADVSRVNARIVEAQASNTNVESDLQAAEDQFRRLCYLEAGPLAEPTSLTKGLPTSLEAALAQAGNSNPRLQSLKATGMAARSELAAQNSNAMPRLAFEGSSTAKQVIADGSGASYDIRGMVVLRYKLSDGGAQYAAQQQAVGKISEAEMRYASARDQIEADIRESFRAIEASRSKFRYLQDGLNASQQAQKLYAEQFTAGKRTAFELMDSQAATFQAEKEVISNRYAELKAVIGLLRATGQLTKTLVASP